MKRRSDFHFKQFSVSHDRSTHKIGTDGVLLGAWVKADHAKYILDIGTGTGVIALMLAQRTRDTTLIDAVEIEPDDARLAEENIQRSPWPRRIHVANTAIQDFFPDHQYDLIVSNPPYFMNSWLPSDKRRSQARHTHNLPYAELLQSSARLLSERGVFAVILPYPEATMFIEMAGKLQLFPARQLLFRSRTHKPPERLLIEFSRQPTEVYHEELVLHGQGDAWSDDYKRLTRGFYLKI